ncbi:hypothetical protein PHYSODRAFT_263366 [Phytophthora sojae]|uniref:Retrotransposon gag domain-containing protein n=1 Tax=Phytophthora sojae (strain P6497) TaxID=1094619 RepID=G4YZ43_PHYSP|nr:hypothetical protein PHYSODRAFT_263366 [Phytophthora sojae]EGZ23324.1 hypothetical protein PHYSODRAFT_263366 [Phytophthora sojae]|eukprot:XP_009518612.1 hypothetical protein PHYSODRAFT_263366 [Phytophthora sojae]
MKAPDSDADDRADLTTVVEDQLAVTYYKKELNAFLLQDNVMKLLRPKLLGDLAGPVSQPTPGSDKLDAVQTLLWLFKVGIIAGALDAESLFNLKPNTIQNSTQRLFLLLKPLVGESSRSLKETSRSPQTLSRSTPARSTPARNPGDQTPTSSPYVSATEDVDSDSVDDPPPRMTLGPSGAAMLRSRTERAGGEAAVPRREPKATATSTRHSPEKLESFFQAAMERFLKEQQLPAIALKSRPTGDQDVEMGSVGSPNRYSTSWEFDPDDLDLGRPVRTAIAATATASPGGIESAPRIRVSAMSELKEFSGKDGDEDRARAWVSKVRLAFVRDQAPDDEKCLVFGDLLTGPARNWCRQLSRTTRTTWKDLLQSFQLQYCGRGVSVARQYYHARKRSDESPLEYLHRLNVADLRTRLQVKDGPPDVHREHVEHFIETLDDRDLADQFALLRIPDADTLEEVLRSRQRAKARQSKTVYGSIKPRPKPPATAGTRAVRAIQIPSDTSDADSGSSGSDEDGDLRRVYATAAGNSNGATEHRISGQDRRLPEQGRNRQDRRPGQHLKPNDMGAPLKRCTLSSMMIWDVGSG